MTELVYESSIYKGYKSSEGIINSLEREIISRLTNACESTDLFIISTWFEFDDEMQRLLACKPKRLVVYSGMDWHDTGYRAEVHNKLNETGIELIYVGNTEGPFYYSFWISFIAHFYKNFDITPSFDIDKLFLCQNRKRHEHRVELVNKLLENQLDTYGLISLGGDLEKGIQPMLLPNDITNIEGDLSTGINNEGITNDISSYGNIENWNRCLINVVTETTVGTNTFISEKTWKPILGLKPFLILGDYSIYHHLKRYGIDTFDDIFGDGYESRDYKDRINWIVEVLNSLKDIDYYNLYKKLLPRLYSNRRRMVEIIGSNDTNFNNIINELQKGNVQDVI